MRSDVDANVVASGSSGNAVIIENKILVDCGVPFKALEPFAKDLNLVLLTHRHSDHFKRSTIRRLSKERPTLRFACCEWMLPCLIQEHVQPSRIDVLKKENAWYNYRNLGIRLKQQHTLHDVPNCCWHIEVNGKKTFYATDLATTEGIEAPGYDLYLIEANREREELERTIAEKREREEFVYEYRVIGTHLFEEQAREFLVNNMDEHSRYIFLHRHKTH